MTVSLKNTSGRLKVIVLAHETFCAARGQCGCDVPAGRGARRTPRSLTLATGVTAAGLDEAVLTLAEVRRALQRGELGVAREVPAPPRTPPQLDSAVVLESPTISHPKKKRGSR